MLASEVGSSLRLTEPPRSPIWPSRLLIIGSPAAELVILLQGRSRLIVCRGSPTVAVLGYGNDKYVGSTYNKQA